MGRFAIIFVLLGCLCVFGCQAPLFDGSRTFERQMEEVDYEISSLRREIRRLERLIEERACRCLPHRPGSKPLGDFGPGAIGKQ